MCSGFSKQNFCLLLVVFGLPVCVAGMPAAQHEPDMAAVLGIDGTSPKVKSCLGVFSKALDNTSFYGREIKYDGATGRNKQFRAFTWGLYTHRLFFHWPFDADPHSHTALSEQVEKAEFTLEVKTIFWGVVLAEQGRRNRAMLVAVENLGYYSRTWKAAIAAIIYDTHLLGDVVESSTEKTRLAVANTGQLNRNLAKAFRGLFSKDHDVSQRLIKGLGKARTSAPDEKGRAQAMLDYLKASVPQALREGSGVHYKILSKSGVVRK